MRKPLLTLLLAVLVGPHAAHDAVACAQPPPADGGAPEPQVADLRQQVSAAIARVKQSGGLDYTLVSKLGETHAAAVLPHILPYLDDPDPHVRLAVENIASRLRTPSALEVMTRLVADPEAFVATQAVSDLYRRFSAADVRKSGPKLAHHLMRHLEREPRDARAILLLSLVDDGHEGVVRFLSRLRNRQVGEKTKLEHGSQPASAVLPVEIALARLGDGTAAERLRQLLRAGEVPDLLLVLDALRFVDDREVLAEVAELLHDPRQAVPYTPYPDPRYLRVQDVALLALSCRFSLPADVAAREPARYSEERLATAYAWVRARLSPRR